jgi:2-hydroxyethylphosphonate dioxygenase
MRIDPFKLAHWLNVRKYTVAHAAKVGGIDEQHWREMLRPDHHGDLDLALVTQVAAVLRVDPAQLAASTPDGVAVAWQSAGDMHATKRLVRRDGIDFYNYYTLAAADGRVAPVVLDILCPPGRVPALNQGHLEPAITVNLGPGDIHGRWGVELTPLNWQVLAANTGADRWITGDSYVEPSFCPHTYSLVDGTPARIVSYTGVSNLSGLLEEVNDWPEDRFARLAGACASGPTTADLLDLLLARRLHDRASAAALIGVSAARLDEALSSPVSEASLALLRELAGALGADYRLLLPPERRWDDSGKIRLDVPAVRDMIRRVHGYRVASMACAPHLPDLVGAYMCVGPETGGRLRDCAETHYFVTGGEASLGWVDEQGEHEVTLSPDGSAWVAPFVDHWWRGPGSMLKLGSGQVLGYQAWFELTNTFAPGATLRRGHRDLRGWGYDG